MRTYHIFCPEYVPLENKGEEAIIRGMADVLFPDGNVEFHILDMKAKEYRFVDGLHVYPGTWFYSQWRMRGFGIGPSYQQLYDSACSILRHGLNYFVPWWVSIPQGPARKTAKRMRKIYAEMATDNQKDGALKRILGCDYLIAGHDGALDECDCHIIDIMREFNMSFGIFGSSMQPRVKNSSIIKTFYESLQNAKFIFCRDIIATEWANKHFPDLNIELAPDPAFGMMPSAGEKTNKLIESEGLIDLFAKPVVMVASAEPPPVAYNSFSDVRSPVEKINAHRDLLASLIKHIVSAHEANILFLPHATGPGPELDDRRVARDILHRAQLPTDRAMVLESELSAKDLKSLIGKAEMLVSERLHAIIGAAGVLTPFYCLASKHDTRLIGIIDNMLNMGDAIYYLNKPNEKELLAHFDRAWSKRYEIRAHLEKVSVTLKHRLNEVANHIRTQMGMQSSKQQL